MKFEFGDLYRFIVSLGVVLIGLALIGPWLFFKEPFDLLRTQAELNALTAVGKAAIADRQEVAAFFVRWMPWFSLLAFAVGLVMIWLGLRSWYKNQVLLDEQAKLELQLKQHLVRASTKDEVVLEAENDYGALEGRGTSHKPEELDAFRTRRERLEELVASKLARSCERTHDVIRHQMMAGVEIDVLLRAKTRRMNRDSDLLIEIKLIRKGFNFGWLKETVLKSAYARNIYSQLTHRRTETLLLIVTDFEGATPDRYASLLSRIEKEELAGQSKDRVVMMTKSDVEGLPAEGLRNRLSL